MRVISLAIVLTFCLIILRTGRNSGILPRLKDQGNWVWLVAAALGGKALQKYAEFQDKRKTIGRSKTNGMRDEKTLLTI